jgi:Flp pilus assembly protein TadG
VTLWVAVVCSTLLAVAAFVIDGGAKIRAGERADLVAGEAARAASYATGPDNAARTAAAASAARAVLTRSGLSGGVTVVAPGRIRVDVQASAVGPMSGMTYSVARDATAQLLIGVTTGEAP